MRVIAWVVGVLAVLVLVLWIGLQVPPRGFGAPPVQAGAVETVPLPEGLPAPVERFLRALYDDALPMVESVVITGRGRIRPMGPWYLPARFRFIHETGTSYRHYIEATWFGFPILTVNEGIIDGSSFFENALIGNEQDRPKTNQGATLALWAEAVWFPSIFATDSRAQWEPVDETTALLRIPFEEGTETFVVRFDAETGALTTMEAMRYRSSDDAARKILWITASEDPPATPTAAPPHTGSATWFDQRTPWAFFTIEEIVQNADVTGYLRARGE